MANLQTSSLSSGSLSVTGNITASSSPWIAFDGGSFGITQYIQASTFYTNYWGYYSTTSFTPCYMKHNGIVEVRGLVKIWDTNDATYGGTGGAGKHGTQNALNTVYTLPVGYRPSKANEFPLMHNGNSYDNWVSSGSQEGNGDAYRMIVETNGEMRLVPYTDVGTAIEWLCLDMTFLAA